MKIQYTVCPAKRANLAVYDAYAFCSHTVYSKMVAMLLCYYI